MPSGTLFPVVRAPTFMSGGPVGSHGQAPLWGSARGRVNNTMTIVAAVVAVLLLGYLVVALVRPEKF